MSNIIHCEGRYFTPKRLAEHYAIGLGERFIRDALKSNERPLPHYRLNQKTILIDKNDFDAWLAKYRVDQQCYVDSVVDEILAEFSTKH